MKPSDRLRFLTLMQTLVRQHPRHIMAFSAEGVLDGIFQHILEQLASLNLPAETGN